MMALIRSSMSGVKLTDEEKNEYSASDICCAIAMAKDYDLAHLVAWGAKQNGLDTEQGAEIERFILKAVYRYQQIKYEYSRLCDLLERHGIPFLPLKGAVIRDCYPEPWMRTSCDIDILVKNEDIKKTHELLVKELGYRYETTYMHDLSFFTPGNVHVEIHFDLIEKGIVGASADVLMDIWDIVTVKEGYKFWFEMPDEIFYFYHVAHMAKHILLGGCGIRPFLDLWMLDNILATDANGIEELLERGGLIKFVMVARRLSDVWFGTGEHDGTTMELESFVLGGNTYGTNENLITVRRTKMGGRMKYALNFIFLPYDAMKDMYPVLKKHKWLLFLMHMRRWCRVFIPGRIKRAKRVLLQNHNISKEHVDRVLVLLEDMGLV